MKIPRGINQLEFATAAKKQGVAISSIYKNVFFYRSSRGKYKWRPSVMIKGKIFQKEFPLTEKGELAAYKYTLDIKNKTLI